jgi:hypothetical protein
MTHGPDIPRWRKVLTSALVAFALISLGYALGKQAGDSSATPSAGSEHLVASPPAGTGAVIIYFHRTQRCEACNTVETVSREIVRQDHAEAVADGRLVLRMADVQKRSDLAERFDLTTSSVVVLRFDEARLVDHTVLDEVLIHWRDRRKLRSYIDSAVTDALAPRSGA